MTCVLGMVVIREREIRNFKETPFYRVVGNFTDAGFLNGFSFFDDYEDYGVEL